LAGLPDHLESKGVECRHLGGYLKLFIYSLFELVPGVHQAKMIEWGLMDHRGQYPFPKALMRPDLHAGYRGGFITDTNYSFIPRTLVPDAILNPPVSWWGCESEMASRENQFKKYTYPMENCPEIHMI
jgi:hypothetical protein